MDFKRRLKYLMLIFQVHLMRKVLSETCTCEGISLCLKCLLASLYMCVYIYIRIYL